LNKNSRQKNDLLTKTDDKTKEFQENNQESSSRFKTYSSVKTHATNSQLI